MPLTKPVDDRHGHGVKVNAWLQPERVQSSGQSRRNLLRALGLGKRKNYPVQARVKGERLVVRAEAHYSAHGNHLRGATRSYLERTDARGPEEHMQSAYVGGVEQPRNVLQNAPIETWLDRWSIWIQPSEADVNPEVMAHVLNEELQQRFGIAEEDIYIVRHYAGKEVADGWHLHAVVRWEPGVDLDRKTMRAIAQGMVRELVLERAVERALDPERRAPTESGWDAAPTDAQMAVLRGAGKADQNMTRGEASMVIEAVTGEKSWAPRDLGRGR